MAITSLANLKLYLGLSLSVTTFDDRLTAILARAESIAIGPNGMGWDPASAATTEVLDGSGIQSLVLSRRPVTAVASVHISSDQVWDANTLLAADSYDLKSADSGILLRTGGLGWESGEGAPLCWPRARACVRVIYTAGWATMPPDLMEAVEMIAADRWARSRQLQSGQPGSTMVGESISGQQSATYVNEIDPRTGIPLPALRTLKRYRSFI
jgi:hypothetical protein